VLAQDAKEEIAAIREVLGTAQMIGFYTYGEQAPIGNQIVAQENASCKAEFCNETVVILGFGE